MDKLNKLKECAFAFNKLLNKEYYIKAVRKDKIIEVRLFFEKEHFYHLLGLHKLRDIEQLKINSVKLFDNILNEKITYKDISSSRFFDDISDRIEYLPYLEQILDDEKTIIKYNKSRCKSSIDAKYILYGKINGLNVHYFIDIDEKKQKYFGRTFFARQDYIYLQDSPYKILEKIVIFKTSEVNNS